MEEEGIVPQHSLLLIVMLLNKIYVVDRNGSHFYLPKRIAWSKSDKMLSHGSIDNRTPSLVVLDYFEIHCRYTGLTIGRSV